MENIGSYENELSSEARGPALDKVFLVISGVLKLFLANGT
jgi:hypothetical protein